MENKDLTYPHRKIYLFTSLLLIAVLIGLSGCSKKRTSPEEFTEKVYSPEYASGFQIQKSKNGKSVVLRTVTPWQGAENVVTSLFISRGGETPPQGFSGQVLAKVPERIVCMSSTQVAMLDAIGEVERVVGVSGRDYVHNWYVSRNPDKVGNVGYEGALDFEMLLSFDPDLVMLYGMNGASPEEGMLKQLGVPFLYIGDYLEESPLGKAEWMVALGEVLGKRQVAEQKFAEIPARYNSLKETVASSPDDNTPKVMLNAPYGNAWFMSPSESYMSRLISDAGAEYVFKKETGTESVKIDREEALHLLSEADFWLNPGSLSSVEEICTIYPKFASASCVREGNVYNNTLRTNRYGGNDYFESGVVHPDQVLSDLIKIFHPELLPDSTFHYFKRLQ